MPDRDRALLEPYLEPAELSLHDVVERPGIAPEHVLFPLSGLVSFIALGARGLRAEAGICGREGVTGLAIVTSADSTPNEGAVQIAGEALRLRSEHLKAAIEQSQSLRELLLRYAQSMWVQTAQTVLSNARCTLEERLSRWLVMCHDRSQGDVLHLTHEFLSVMLGVRRAGVTVATHYLEGKGLIRASRGTIAILDRKGLERNAGGSYGVAEAEFNRLIGPSRG